MKDPLKGRVRKINNRWHCRLYACKESGEIRVDEMACDKKANMTYCFHVMMRRYDTLCFSPASPRAKAERQKVVAKVPGRIFYKIQLDHEKQLAA